MDGRSFRRRYLNEVLLVFSSVKVYMRVCATVFAVIFGLHPFLVNVIYDICNMISGYR